MKSKSKFISKPVESKIYRFNVSWTLSQDVEIEANSAEEAMKIARDMDLPTNGEYEDGSFTVRDTEGDEQ